MSVIQTFGFMLVLFVARSESTNKTLKLKDIDEKYNYCNLYECGSNHVACFSYRDHNECPRKALIMDIEPYHNFIVDLHNRYRNWTAGGVCGLRRAARMGTMRWDKDLAYVAHASVKKCKLNTELCHNTRRFEYSGQNAMIQGYRTSRTPENMKAVLKFNIATWFQQITVCPNAIIKSYQDPTVQNQVYGHFTLVANERNTHVGCAAVYYPRGNYYHLLFLCNYAVNNIVGQPVYTSSVRASGRCRTGRNKRYPNLCSLREPYDHRYSREQGDE